MKICFDSSVLLDIVKKSKDKLTSFASVDVCYVRNFDVYVSANALLELDNITSSCTQLSEGNKQNAMVFAMNEFQLIDVLASDCKQAYESDMSDFSNALVSSSAGRVGIDLIVSRDKAGFESSLVPVMTPEEFLKIYKPENITYSEIDGMPFVEEAEK